MGFRRMLGNTAPGKREVRDGVFEVRGEEKRCEVRVHDDGDRLVTDEKEEKREEEWSGVEWRGEDGRRGRRGKSSGSHDLDWSTVVCI